MADHNQLTILIVGVPDTERSPPTAFLSAPLRLKHRSSDGLGSHLQVPSNALFSVSSVLYAWQTRCRLSFALHALTL